MNEEMIFRMFGFTPEQIEQFRQYTQAHEDPRSRINERFSPDAAKVLEAAHQTMKNYKQASKILRVPLDHDIIADRMKGIMDLLEALGLTEDNLTEYIHYAKRER